MAKVESFVFFDLETTGLPWQEKNRTKIIEFSFVAALRKDLETALFGEIPPVRKLTFLLNPERPVDPVVTQMTGLSNDMLRHAPTFGQMLKKLVAFVEDLPPPVCLVAHNGNAFDFKILLAECKDINASLPAHLLCVDSLLGFRKLLKGTNINYKDLQNQIPTSSLDDLLTDDDDDWPDLNLSKEDWSEIDDICLSMSDISCEDFEQDEQEEKKIKINKTIQKKRSEAIKNVFSNNRTPKKVLSKKSTTIKNSNTVKDDYKLTTLYKRLLNKEEVNAHRAEADCLMLAQCVVALKYEFLPWADRNSKPLSEIKPLIRY
ncbi:DNA polymerase III PolC-type-like [Pectinophora gossypiella]|uniref:DNA polymerase III PolC-type-like n=1 Tax=Pectinophora gossypiella TaxID=13191 RepID=UPI00214EC8AB|nr:DNA polymerase III PolC-type-like [Pectinophora gossypiella]